MAVEMKCLVLDHKADSIEQMAPRIAERRLVLDPASGPQKVVVEVKAAAVNPSDAKAAIGMMPYAKFPRIPGRDYSGLVVEGPQDWLGAAVFGSSGDLGIRCDGSHATHLTVEADALDRNELEDHAAGGVQHREEGLRLLRVAGAHGCSELRQHPVEGLAVVVHDRLAAATQAIHQGGFAHIGAANDGNDRQSQGVMTTTVLP